MRERDLAPQDKYATRIVGEPATPLRHQTVELVLPLKSGPP